MLHIPLSSPFYKFAESLLCAATRAGTGYSVLKQTKGLSLGDFHAVQRGRQTQTTKQEVMPSWALRVKNQPGKHGVHTMLRGEERAMNTCSNELNWLVSSSIIKWMLKITVFISYYSPGRFHSLSQPAVSQYQWLFL